ncbi:MAG: extensin family protein [Bradyrhizobium sp.]|uniref:extensin family protein n=1 Tax=Bradyrhizobium sp. TaxID=376 RepID=UPI00271A92D7|nr:extensin family protein [Bradyrhizobium sp.]MDO9563820.1 extensin family protein [Bradyrhizobium sp.]MDP3691823.1 extensin family protein [Bradyrhizobium sp.]
MNFSAEKAGRKWPCGSFSPVAAAMVTAAALLWLCVPSIPAAAATKGGAWPPAPWSALFGTSRPKKPRRAVQAVPIPKPRPAEAPKAAESKPAESKPVESKAAQSGKAEPGRAGSNKADSRPEPDKAETDKPEAEKPAAATAEKAAEPASPVPPPPSACRLALTEAIAIAPSIPDIKGAGGCGGEDLVRLEVVVLPDKRRVTVKPAAVLRCAMASAIADWIRTDMAQLAESLGSTISDLDNFDSYQCRGRNRVFGARLSEHGRANALDIRAIKLANGSRISFTDRMVPRETRESVLHSMCARFPTVLGPGSDWYHEDHIHIDLMERRNNYKICQWNVWDPMPQIAPLLPAERPEEAPPREVAAKVEQGKPELGKPEQVKPDAAKSAVPEPAAAPPATKKRRQDRRF